MENNTNVERHLLPNGLEVMFYPEEHRYFVGDTELPSITTLLKEHYGDKYSMVRPEILQAAAKYGTKVHEELEHFINLRKEDKDAVIESEHEEVLNYFNFVEPIYGIEPITTEKVVVLYGADGKPAAAGRFDLLCLVFLILLEYDHSV